jgi:hypothetical protein
MFTVERINQPPPSSISTRADEPFFRGDEPERRPRLRRRRFVKLRR